MAFGPLTILQCDNEKEFKGALLQVLKKHEVKLVNRNLRSLQTQGLVEQGNGVVEQKLRA